MNHVAEINALKARVAFLEGKLGPRLTAEITPLDAQFLARQGSMIRDANGAVIVDPVVNSDEAYNARAAARNAAAAAEAAAYDAKCRAGLPSGLFRDPCGLVRDGQGKIAPIEAVEGRPQGAPENIARAEVEEGQRREHHRFLTDNRLTAPYERETWPDSARASVNKDA